MSAKNNYFKIGLFALAGVGILVGGLLAFGARSYFEEKTTFETCVVGDVEGLSIGSVVKLRGVPIGQVTRIDFTWNSYPESHKSYVVIEFQVRRAIASGKHGDVKATTDGEVAKGLRALVKGQGITGSSIVSLDYLDPIVAPPPVIDYTPKHYYIPSAPSQFTQMLSSLERSLHNIEQLDFGQINGGVSNVLSSTERLMGKLEKLDFAGFSTNANALVAELRNTSQKLQSAIDQVQNTIKAMGLESIGKNADGLLAELRTTNGKLQKTLENLNTASVPESLANIRQATESINEVLEELKRYPSGFLFGQPPPPARSVQPPRK
jgi:ABC-type transporter Mla subunit MlaD